MLTKHVRQQRHISAPAFKTCTNPHLLDSFLNSSHILLVPQIRPHVKSTQAVTHCVCRAKLGVNEPCSAHEQRGAVYPHVARKWGSYKQKQPTACTPIHDSIDLAYPCTGHDACLFISPPSNSPQKKQAAPSNS